jgi:glycogen(starch) synthase
VKVLMTVDAVGGVWTYALALSRALARCDVQVVLACLGPQPTAAQRASARETSNLTIECCDCKLEWMAQPWSDVTRAGEWLLQLADREHVDLIHLNGYAHAALRWNRPVIVVAHSCVYSWWQAVHGCDPPPEWRTYFDRVAAGLDCADCIVAPTRAFLDSIRRIYRPTTATRVIHNGGSIAVSTTATQRLPVVFASGRAWDRAKGMDVLDLAARDLAWRGYLAGPVTAPDGARVRLSSLRALGTLTTNDHAAWLQRAAIFAHPARYEPFGLGVLEAALGGCALVLSDLPTLRELWEGAARFVPSNDAAALHDALSRLIGDPERLIELANDSWIRAQRYRPEKMAAEYMLLYRELLARSQPRAREVA